MTAALVLILVLVIIGMYFYVEFTRTSLELSDLKHQVSKTDGTDLLFINVRFDRLAKEVSTPSHKATLEEVRVALKEVNRKYNYTQYQ